MKKILFVIILFVSTTVLAQSVDSIKFKRVKVGIVFSPDYCYRLLNYHSSNKWVQDLRNDEEVPTFGYTTGISLKIDATSKIVLETGFYYSIKGERTKTIEFTWATPSSDYPSKSKTQYQYKYIDIPLKVQYFLGSKRIKPFISVGVSATIFSEKKTKVILEFSDGHKASENSTTDLACLKFNLVTIVGFGIKYDLSKRIFIIIEPVYRQFINSIVVDRSAKEHPFSIGTNFGVYYTLKKKDKHN